MKKALTINPTKCSCSLLYKMSKLITFKSKQTAMNKYALLLITCLGLILMGCADNKKEIHKEISIEKKKINDSLVRATVITKYTTGDEVKEDVQVIEGTPGEVNSKLEVYKKEILMQNSEEPHGAWGSDTGYHRGEIGNFNADDTVHGMITFSTDLWCLGCEDETKDLLGKAIIAHQGEDDLSSQPSGAAGARVSCAGIIQ